VRVDAERQKVEAPVSAAAGMTTGVVRSLDAAGVAVDSVTVHRPSLNDVFLALTGSAAGTVTDQDTERELEGASA
jgi:ABC-2 type transport system ATP-binding protein